MVTLKRVSLSIISFVTSGVGILGLGLTDAPDLLPVNEDFIYSISKIKYNFRDHFSL